MTFSGMAGNRPAVKRLQDMLSGGRVPPSLLFTGPVGTGKRQAALNLAKALNCARAEPGADDACDQCSVCRRIDQGSHPDVRQIGREGPGGQVTVDAVRQVIVESPFRPFEGRKRVYIFEEADRMNPNAANTLLKTLEEPPPWTVLVLLTAHEAAILPTLRSRCQRIRFLPLAPEEVAETLVEKYRVPADRATVAAAMSGGNLSRALAALDEELDEVRGQAARMARVPTERAALHDILSWAERLARDTHLTDILRVEVCLLRDLASVAAGGKPLYTQAVADMETLAGNAVLEVWLDCFLRVEQALHDIEIRYANKRITVENLLVGLAASGRQSRTATGVRTERSSL